MQVLTIAVQNTVDYADLGVATSGVTFLRSIGSSFGAAIFGSIYSSQLTANLTSTLATHPLPQGVDPHVTAVPSLLHALPDALSAPIVQAYSDSLHTVFLYAVPVGVVALLVSFFLKEMPLRDTSRASAPEMGEGFAMPEARDSDRELERAIATLLYRERRQAAPEILGRSGTSLDEGGVWCLMRVKFQHKLHRPATVAAIAERHRIPGKVFEPAFFALEFSGYLERRGEELELTERGHAEFERLAHAWRDWIVERLADWRTDGRADLDAAIDRVAARMIEQAGDEQRQGRHALV